MEIVQDANTEILKSPEKYFLYLKNQIEQIIQDYDIEYTEIKDDRKTYPKFTKKQFIFIMDTLNERVFKSNVMLLKNDIYINRYDINKVELCYLVFKRICSYYNITFTLEIFCIYSGIQKNLLVEWLNSGKSRLFLNICQDINSFDNFDMINSENSLLRAYYRNNQNFERLEVGNADTLPDLLTDNNQNLSLPDAQSTNI